MTRLGRRYLLCLAALALAAAAPDGSCGAACDGRIWFVTIVAMMPGPWQTAGPSRSRTVTLRLRVDQVLRGPRLGTDLVQTRVVQFAPAGSRSFAVPGVWSGLTPEPGTRWVMFLRGMEQTGQDLTEGETRLVMPAATAAADAAFIVDADRDHISLPQMIDRLSRQTVNFGPVLGAALLSRAEAVVPGDVAGFVALARLLRRPGLPHAFRWQVYGGLVGLLTRHDTAPPEFAASLALTGFDLLSTPDATAMRAALVGTWLPTLLGLTGALPRLSPGIVFAARDDRARAAAALANDGSPGLRAWLDAGRP